MSPDTDTYHIGLTQDIPGKHIVVEISPIASREKILDLTVLKEVFVNDPHICTIQSETLFQSLQTV